MRDKNLENAVWHLKFRPDCFDDVVGQDPAIKSLKSLFNAKESVPHSFLFSGPSGTGKTTLTRIIAKEAGCLKQNIIEVDAATNTGVDSIRTLQEGLRYGAIGKNNIKFIIFDECFAKGTKVSTLLGDKNIENIVVGDSVFNLEGSVKVKTIFKNKIDLNRIVKIVLENRVIFCSSDHKFFTSKGWTKAIDLKNSLTFSCDFSKLKSNINLVKESVNEKIRSEQESEFLWKTTRFGKIQEMQRLWRGFLGQDMESRFLRGVPQYRESLQFLWRKVYKKSQVTSKELFSYLWKQICWNTKTRQTFNYLETSIEKRQSKIFRRKPSTLEEIVFRFFSKNERKQSYVQFKNYRKNDEHKKNKWNFEYLVRRAWREWEMYRTPKTLSYCFGLVNGGAYFFREKTNGLSNELQNRYRKQRIENGDRSRWEKSQAEREYIERQEKGEQIKRIRVESVEIYKRGYNDESFKSIIADKERNQEFVEFYDLEIEGHPSYYANGILVHNCHQFSKSAWNSLLKIIEEPPKHVFFAFCTTELNKVPKTIQTRCHHYALKDVSTDDLLDLLEYVCDTEKLVLDDKSLNLVAKEAQGSPRKALVCLSKVRDCSSSKETAVILETLESEGIVIELCRLLIKRASWKQVITKYKTLSEINPESVRRAVFNYCTKCLLNPINDADTPFFLDILDAFKSPLYDMNTAKGELLLMFSVILD